MRETPEEIADLQRMFDAYPGHPNLHGRGGLGRPVLSRTIGALDNVT